MLIEDAKKEIKTYVTDENTQKEVLLILDAQTKANKEYQKEIGKYQKSLKDVNANYSSNEEDMKKEQRCCCSTTMHQQQTLTPTHACMHACMLLDSSPHIKKARPRET